MDYTYTVMKRKYEIAVISKGDFAKTIRIYNAKKADTAIIALDCQSFFTGDAAKTVFSACKRKKLALIGVDGSDGKFYEFLPFESENTVNGLPPCGGGADALADYLTTALVPYLDKRFGFKRFAVFGRSLSSAAALYTAQKGSGLIFAYGLSDAPLFISPSAFDKLLKSSKPDSARYYIYCTANAEYLPENIPQKAYAASAVAIAAALADNDIQNITLDIKTDKAAVRSSDILIEFLNGITFA